VLALRVMSDYDYGFYGSTFAGVYDAWYDERMNPETTASFLSSFASAGRVLELGIGTGRVALTLASRGIGVAGVEGSAAMVDVLRSKPGGSEIPVTIGNFADVPVSGEFSLIYICFSSLFLLPSQAEQIRCMRNVAAHLAPGGHFILDAFRPDVTRYVNSQCVSVEDMSDREVRLDLARHDPIEQRIQSSRVVLGDQGVKVYPYTVRYAYPAELDVMAMLAGMRLSERYGDYDRQPFRPTSAGHVSIYTVVR
jgi:SAM-dependent methyltransferase